jgi:hypothetical protein
MAGGSAEGLVSRLRDALVAGDVLDLGEPTSGEDTSDFDWSDRLLAATDLVRLLADPSGVHRHGLRLIGAQISGSVDLSDISRPMQLSFAHCWFDETIDLSRSSLSSVSFVDCSFAPALEQPDLRLALNAVDVCLDHDLLFRGSQIAGSIVLDSAKIGGLLDFRETTIDGYGGPAVQAQSATIGEDVGLTEAIVNGVVNLRSAKIGGQLDCREAKLSSEGGYPAVFAQSATIGEDVGFARAVVSGGVNLDGAKIGGQLQLREAKLKGGYALTALRATVGEDLLAVGATFTGPVMLRGARINGQLEFAESTIAGGFGPAVLLERAAVGEHLGFARATVAGAMNLNYARVGGQFVCHEATFKGSGGEAIVAEAAQLGAFVWRDVQYVEGRVNLTGADVRVWTDDLQSWAHPNCDFQLEELNIERLAAEAVSSWGWRWRRTWLGLQRHQSRHLPGPYLLFARLAAEEGDGKGARKLRIAANDAISSRRRRLTVGLLIGHGYEPGRIAVPLIALYLLVTAFVWWGAANNRFLAVAGTAPSRTESSHCTQSYPCLSPVAYGFETVVPLVDLNQERYWQPNSATTIWLSRTVWVGRILGWLFATLVLAGFTGLVKRE